MKGLFMSALAADTRESVVSMIRVATARAVVAVQRLVELIIEVEIVVRTGEEFTVGRVAFVANCWGR